MTEQRQAKAAALPAIKFVKVAAEWGASVIPTPEEEEEEEEEEDYFRALGKEYIPPQARS